MTGIIPCLYNSFSFTLENIIGGDIVCYKPRIARERNLPAPAVVSAAEVTPAPAPVFVYIPPSLIETSGTDTDTKSDTDSDTDSADDCDSDIDSVMSQSQPTLQTPPPPSFVFHPDIMTQYRYSTSGSDSILWSAYIMLYGIEKYEMIENPYVESNRFKFELIEVLRQNKPILKANKIKLNATEECLVHKPFIALETLHAVAVCKSLSVCIVQDRKYYEIANGSSSGDGGAFIIEKIKGKYVLYIAPNKLNMDYLTYIRTNYWLMESISAPIRPISAYKLQDLIDISQKLNLPVVNVIPGKFGSMGTEKRKTKPELYEGICRCI
jgi:hypothetical protein